MEWYKFDQLIYPYYPFLLTKTLPLTLHTNSLDTLSETHTLYTYTKMQFTTLAVSALAAVSAVAAAPAQKRAGGSGQATYYYQVRIATHHPGRVDFIRHPHRSYLVPVGGNPFSSSINHVLTFFACYHHLLCTTERQPRLVRKVPQRPDPHCCRQLCSDEQRNVRSEGVDSG